MRQIPQIECLFDCGQTMLVVGSGGAALVAPSRAAMLGAAAGVAVVVDLEKAYNYFRRNPTTRDSVSIDVACEASGLTKDEFDSWIEDGTFAMTENRKVSAADVFALGVCATLAKRGTTRRAIAATARLLRKRTEASACETAG
jgi:hypothetical protein